MEFAAMLDLFEEGRGPLWGMQSQDSNARRAWPGGAGVAEHRTDERDVLVLALTGSATVRLDGVEHELTQHALMLLPRGSLRALTAGAEGVRYLSVHTRKEPLLPTQRTTGPRRIRRGVNRLTGLYVSRQNGLSVPQHLLRHADVDGHDHAWRTGADRDRVAFRPVRRDRTTRARANAMRSPWWPLGAESRERRMRGTLLDEARLGARRRHARCSCPCSGGPLPPHPKGTSQMARNLWKVSYTTAGHKGLLAEGGSSRPR
jgi:hypothetical protein